MAPPGRFFDQDAPEPPPPAGRPRGRRARLFDQDAAEAAPARALPVLRFPGPRHAPLPQPAAPRPPPAQPPPPVA
ncbi:MAG: hypothetical protein ACYCUG_07945, partial [Acidimicrobiales bacterium]